MRTVTCDICGKDASDGLQIGQKDICDECAKQIVVAAAVRIARKCPDCTGWDAFDHKTSAWWPLLGHATGCDTRLGRRGWRKLGEYDG